MSQERVEEPEKVLWEEYLKACKEEGKSPSPGDFAKWAKSMLGNL